jgi:hypothetical protein
MQDCLEAKMATDFPLELDTLINPTSTNALSAPSHSEQHANANDAIEALQAKVGIDGSEDPDSLDYKISTVETQIANLGSSGATTVELLGLEGNNDTSATVCDIENATVLDTFTSSAWGTVKYTLQVTRGSSMYSADILVLNDGTNINVSESNIISNTDSNLFTYTFELNSGIISLKITPVSTAVTARYYRTAVKK